MANKTNKEIWLDYAHEELKKARPVLEKLGFGFINEQVHLSGERYLMSGQKLVLTGIRKKDDLQVIIKLSSKKSGKQEIIREYKCNCILQNLKFSHYSFYLPRILLYKEIDGFSIIITSYIRQSKAFLEFSTKEQFFLALRTFEIQAGTQATTAAHIRKIKNAFGIMDADSYLDSFSGLAKKCIKFDQQNKKLMEVLNKAQYFLNKNKENLSLYGKFFTHGDFAPHNLRIVDRDIYLLDQTSIHFGNKYESWARFLNFMILYNKVLEEWLVQYVSDNRSKEEFLSLRLLRIYKLGNLLEYYTKSLDKTTGDLRTLTEIRINFWCSIMECLLEDKKIPEQLIQDYKRDRDDLRSEEEKNRQRKIRQLK